MNKKIIDGKKIALKVTSEIKDKIEIMSKGQNIVPGLAVILIGENPASISYVKGKEKASTCCKVLNKLLLSGWVKSIINDRDFLLVFKNLFVFHV